MPPLEFSAVVLVGGRSSRMGCDKALLPHPLTRVPLICHQVELLQSLGAASVLLSVRRGQDYPEFFPTLPRVSDDGEAGPLPALEASLVACPSEWLLVVAVDLPYLSCDFLRGLLAACGPQRGAMPTHAGRRPRFEPLCAVYPKSTVFLAALAEARRAGRLSLQAVLDEAVTKKWIRPVSVTESDIVGLANWNSPGDLEVRPPSP